uniref:F-box domain-containing protein n=1 Tax=Ditylenchus dipsaci TaxID=166011 RepID=A0A915CRI0_9BILA
MDSKSFVMPSETMQNIVAHFSLIDCKDLVLTSKILSCHSLIRLKKYKKLEMKRRKKQKRVDALKKLNEENNVLDESIEEMFERMDRKFWKEVEEGSPKNMVKKGWEELKEKSFKKMFERMERKFWKKSEEGSAEKMLENMAKEGWEEIENEINGIKKSKKKLS